MAKFLKILFLNRYHMRFLAVSLTDVIIACIGCYQFAIGSDIRIITSCRKTPAFRHGGYKAQSQYQKEKTE